MIEQLLDDYFLLFFIVGWAGISLIISTMSWRKLLATEYALEGEVKGEKFRSQRSVVSLDDKAQIG